jgi:hypothetical protein
MLHFEPVSGYGEYKIILEDIKELRTFNSWTTYVFIDFRINIVICPKFHYLN